MFVILICDHQDKDELIHGGGGRVEVNIVDEFTTPGGGSTTARLRAPEEIHQEANALPDEVSNNYSHWILCAIVLSFTSLALANVCIIQTNLTI